MTSILPRMRTSRLVLLICLLALTGCGGSTGADPTGRFSAALPLVPAGAEVHLTDWAALKSAGGESEPAGGEAQVKLMLDLAERGISPVFTYDVVRYPDHEEQWGWDLADVEWEAVIVRDAGAPAFVLGMGDTFDVSELVPILEERGYQSRDVEGVPVYEHELDPQVEWLQSPTGLAAPLAVFNVAVLTEQNVIIASSEPANIEAALTQPDLTTDEALTATLEQLDDPLLAGLAPGGEDRCGRVVQVSGGGTPEIQKVAVDPFRGQQYEAIGYGYDVEGDTVSARLVLRYGDASAAESDLEVRQSAAQQPSLRTRTPNGSFTVEETVVEGQHIVAEIGPNEQGEVRLAEAYAQGDLLIAAC